MTFLTHISQGRELTVDLDFCINLYIQLHTVYSICCCTAKIAIFQARRKCFIVFPLLTYFTYAFTHFAYPPNLVILSLLLTDVTWLLPLFSFLPLATELLNLPVYLTYLLAFWFLITIKIFFVHFIYILVAHNSNREYKVS